jgi:regulator of replication initiation timing
MNIMGSMSYNELSEKCSNKHREIEELRAELARRDWGPKWGNPGFEGTTFFLWHDDGCDVFLHKVISDGPFEIAFRKKGDGPKQVCTFDCDLTKKLHEWKDRAMRLGFMVGPDDRGDRIKRLTEANDKWLAEYRRVDIQCTKWANYFNDYSLRLAGVLGVVEGNVHRADIDAACDVVKNCPTIRSALKLREDYDALVARTEGGKIADKVEGLKHHVRSLERNIAGLKQQVLDRVRENQKLREEIRELRHHASGGSISRWAACQSIVADVGALSRRYGYPICVEIFEDGSGGLWRMPKPAGDFVKKGDLGGWGDAKIEGDFASQFADFLHDELGPREVVLENKVYGIDFWLKQPGNFPCTYQYNTGEYDVIT